MSLLASITTNIIWMVGHIPNIFIRKVSFIL